MIWQRHSLRGRVLIVAAALSALTAAGGLFSLWYSLQTKTFFNVVDEQMFALKFAKDIKMALVMQKGYITYFFQDKNPFWIKELEDQHQKFTKLLNEAESRVKTSTEQDILARIIHNYQNFCQLRNEVIDRYEAGESQTVFKIHKEARREFFEILDLTDSYYSYNENHVFRALTEIRKRARYMSTLALVALPVTVFLSIMLLVILIRQILGPIRRLAREAASTNGPGFQGSDIQILTHGVHDLMEDVQQTRSELKTREEQLFTAAKLASVGKLAASVAHSIRNPLTSVKMRLYSLQKSQSLTEGQLEDCRVISEEVGNIDNVLCSFLEFSRRPKLELRQISPSDIVDMAVELVRPRLESSNIELKVERTGRLPEIQADPAQLKEAIVNLMVNALESMRESGKITIREEQAEVSAPNPTLIVRVSDNGPGIPEAIRYQVFHPFFSTKGEGTGLGLSITKRIVEEHGGVIHLESSSSQRTSFAIVLPVKEE